MLIILITYRNWFLNLWISNKIIFDSILSVTNKYIKRNIINQLSSTSTNSGVNLNIIKSIVSGNVESPPEEDIDEKNKQPPIYIKCKCINDQKLIIGALNLFSRVKNSLFGKDMLFFYQNKIENIKK